MAVSMASSFSFVTRLFVGFALLRRTLTRFQFFSLVHATCVLVSLFLLAVSRFLSGLKFSASVDSASVYCSHIRTGS